jgi:hypothetical protein
MRGVDADGNCANFVETEQVVQYDSDPSQARPTIRHISSFIQVLRDRAFHHPSLFLFLKMRGSVPLFWSQKPNLKWQPDPSIRSLDEQFQCFKMHLSNLFQKYGREALSGLPRKIVIIRYYLLALFRNYFQVILNLINHYGREDKIGTQLREVVGKLNTASVKYVAFDFHRHCQSLNWDRLALLKEELEPDIGQFG